MIHYKDPKKAIWINKEQDENMENMFFIKLKRFRAFYFWLARDMWNKDDTIILIGFLESLNHGSLQYLTHGR